MGSLGQIVKGGVPHKGHMLAHAMALESTLDMVSDAFKTQTSGGKTTATDKIWTDWKGFVAKANDASKAANALVRTIEDDGDMEVEEPEETQARFIAMSEKRRRHHPPMRLCIPKCGVGFRDARLAHRGVP